MQRVAVVTDSTADLVPELVQGHAVTVVPLTVNLDGHRHVLDAMAALGSRPRYVFTSSPAVQTSALDRDEEYATTNAAHEPTTDHHAAKCSRVRQNSGRCVTSQ